MGGKDAEVCKRPAGFSLCSATDCGTIVSRDSEGQVHVFFGHVCGYVSATGEALEEFFTSLRGYNGVEEKSLHGFE